MCICDYISKKIQLMIVIAYGQWLQWVKSDYSFIYIGCFPNMKIRKGYQNSLSKMIMIWYYVSDNQSTDVFANGKNFAGNNF